MATRSARRVGFARRGCFSRLGQDFRLGIGFARRGCFSRLGQDFRLGIGFARRIVLGSPDATGGLSTCVSGLRMQWWTSHQKHPSLSAPRVGFARRGCFSRLGQDFRLGIGFARRPGLFGKITAHLRVMPSRNHERSRASRDTTGRLGRRGAVGDPTAHLTSGTDLTLMPGSREVLLLPRPLRTGRESCPSSSSSLHKRPSRDAAAFVRSSCTWICR